MTFLLRLPSHRFSCVRLSHLRLASLPLVTLGLLAFGLLTPAAAAPSRVETPQATVSLIADRIAVDGASAVRVGLQYDLKEDWKVYWRSPGDAGYPATLAWQGSENTTAEQIRTDWPVPVRFSVLGIETLGYKHQVVFPLTVPVNDPAQPLRLRLAVDYLICSEICVPGQVSLALDLPAEAPPDRQLLADAAASAHLIDQYAAQVPAPGGQGIGLSALTLSADGEGRQTVTATVTALPPLTRPDLFLEGPVNGITGLISGPPTVRPGPNGTVTLSAPLTTPLPLTAPPPVRVTVADSGRGLDATLSPTVTAALPETTATALLAILGIALLGGLILNIMPCVLPVLSLKLLHLVKAAGTERPVLRRSFLGTAAGIITTFLIMAGILTGLKLAGAAIGWGIQFQQPVFLGGMIVLLLLFAANLLGAFTLRLPGVIGDLAARPGGGAFANGVFATLLATPCSAPFLGTAVGFALARGPLEIVAIFAALGLGMSLPYLAVAAAPGLATVLPRPGRWMATAKRVLALPLIGTALWLGSILLPQLLPAPAATAASQTLWGRFEPDRIDTLVANGQTVLVDVTADWCVTCKINKLTVLDSAEILPRLSQPGIVAMQADWTRPDPVISAFLARYGRYGIPFNVVYGPGAPQGIPLPEILTPDALISALDKAKG